MSTATAFLAIGSFPYCPATVTSFDAQTYESFQWIGPFSLSEAMALYWNTEQVDFSINGRVIPVVSEYQPLTDPEDFPVYPSPADRVCQPSQWYGRKFWDLGGSDEESGSCGLSSSIQISGSYYVGVQAAYFAPKTSQNEHLTTLCKFAPGPDWTAAATYSGTVFGKSATFYRYWFVDYYPTYTGSDDATVTATYYTY